MVERITAYDPAEYLHSEKEIAAYLNDIAQDDDPALLASALADVARARSMAELAAKTGMSREGLYRITSGRNKGKPSFETVSKIASALGVRIAFAPKRQPKAAASRIAEALPARVKAGPRIAKAAEPMFAATPKVKTPRAMPVSKVRAYAASAKAKPTRSEKAISAKSIAPKPAKQKASTRDKASKPARRVVFRA